MQRVLGFPRDILSKIYLGEKRLTYRLNREGRYDDLFVGQRLPAEESRSRIRFGNIEIRGLTPTTFCQIPLDQPGHEAYASRDEMRHVLSAHYGDLHDTDPFLMIEFQLLFTCTSARRSIRQFFSRLHHVIHRRNFPPKGYEQAIAHMTAGTQLGEHYIACQPCWDYYMALKRNNCGG